MDSAINPDTSSSTRSDQPSVLCDVGLALADIPAMSAGVLWRLTQAGRQLDANLVHLAPREQIGYHTEPDLDVLLVVVSGDGSLSTHNGLLQLTVGLLVWLPRGAARRRGGGIGLPDCARPPTRHGDSSQTAWGTPCGPSTTKRHLRLACELGAQARR